MEQLTRIQSTPWKFFTVEVRSKELLFIAAFLRVYLEVLIPLPLSSCSLFLTNRGEFPFMRRSCFSLTDVASNHLCSSAQYCEYMPEPAKCRQWLEKNFPDVFARMTVGKFLPRSPFLPQRWYNDKVELRLFIAYSGLSCGGCKETWTSALLLFPFWRTLLVKTPLCFR